MAILAFDAKRAFCNSSGLGVYSRTLIRSLADHYPENDYHLFTPSDKGLFKEAESGFTIHTAPSFIPGSLWRSGLCAPAIRRSGASVYHGLSNELPAGDLGKTTAIVTIHDLIFLSHPKLYPAVDRFFYKRKFFSAIERAGHIIAISHKTASEIRERSGRDDLKTSVIYQACSKDFFDGKTYPRPEGIPENYLLFVGNVEERKGLHTLLQALSRTPDIPLVIAGRHTSYVNNLKDFVARQKMENRVIFTGKVNQKELHGLYQNCMALVYPSFAEGWGLPVAEALCCGKPVITTRGTSMEEIATGAGLFFDAFDPGQLAACIGKITSDEETRKTLSEKGKVISENFRPSIAAAKYMSIYEQYF